MKITFKKQKPEVFERRKPGSEESPKVFSYYARGSSNSNQNIGRHEPGATRKPKSYKHLVYVPSYIALCMVVIAGLYSCWLQPNPRVVILSQKGTVYRSSQEYQNGIAALWRRSFLNQTKLTIHGATIKNDILAQYSELADVRIELPLLGRRPTIILTPAVPVLQFISSNGAFYVNAGGKVMARVTEVTQNQLRNVPVVHDETNIPAESGKNVVPESEAKFLQKLSAQLIGEGIPADAITLPLTAANEADVHVIGQTYFIKFSILGDPRQAVGSYQTVKSKLEAEHTIPKEYIDVRVEEKVFYK